MRVRVRVPASFRESTKGAATTEISGQTVGEVLTELCKEHDGVENRLFRAPGELHRFVNVYVNDEDIRFLSNLSTPVSDGDEVSIVAAIAGG